MQSNSLGTFQTVWLLIKPVENPLEEFATRIGTSAEWPSQTLGVEDKVSIIVGKEVKIH